MIWEGEAMAKRPKRQPKAKPDAEPLNIDALLALAQKRLATVAPDQLRRARRSLWRSENPGVYRWSRD
jgi:hypothetical protein